jgi:hypothetical protein
MTKLMVVFRTFYNAPEKGKMAALGCVFYIPGPLFCCEAHMCRAEVNSCTWFPWHYSLLKKIRRKFSLFQIHVTIKLCVPVFFCLFHYRSSHLNPAVLCASRQGGTKAARSPRYAYGSELRAVQCWMNGGLEITRREDCM